MNFEVEFLKVGDADAILIREYIDNKPYVILIDAGNVGDGTNVIIPHLTQYYTDAKTDDGRCCINLAICTHPDKDHKGGFFDLLESKDVYIHTFWLTDPASFLNVDDLKRYQNRENAVKAVRKIFCHPNNDSKNLIDLAYEKCKEVINVTAGHSNSQLGIKIVGPSSEYYNEVVRDMVKEYGVETYDESDTTDYDEQAKIDADQAQSVIDTENDDPSPFNKSSILVYYNPADDVNYLFAGDATRASLTEAIKQYPEIKNVSGFKVPHHGSKHNLSTQIMADLKPKVSYISCKGTSKHPNSTLVYWLSKYGDIFSTHKCKGWIRNNRGISRDNIHSLDPLKKKQ